MTALFLMILLFSAQSVPPAVPATPSAAESWRFYGGDYATWSALDTLSVRREGDVAHTRQVVWGQRGPLDVAGRPFDYVVLEVAYDCALQTSHSIRAHYFARGGALLWSGEINSRPRSTRNSSPYVHFRDYICADGPATADPSGYPSLRAMFENQRSWLLD